MERSEGQAGTKRKGGGDESLDQKTVKKGGYYMEIKESRIAGVLGTCDRAWAGGHTEAV